MYGKKIISQDVYYGIKNICNPISKTRVWDITSKAALLWIQTKKMFWLHTKPRSPYNSPNYIPVPVSSYMLPFCLVIALTFT